MRPMGDEAQDDGKVDQETETFDMSATLHLHGLIEVTMIVTGLPTITTEDLEVETQAIHRNREDQPVEANLPKRS